jgi:hypothetical protein
MMAIAIVSFACNGSGNTTTKEVCAIAWGVGEGAAMAGVCVDVPELIGFSNNERVQACPTRTSTTAAVMIRRDDIDCIFILSPRM